MTFIYVYFRWGLESQIVDIRYLILILTRELVSDVVERHRVVEAESRGTVKQKMQEQHGGGGGTPPHPGHKLPTVIHRSTQLSMKAMARQYHCGVDGVVDTHCKVVLVPVTAPHKNYR